MRTILSFIIGFLASGIIIVSLETNNYYEEKIESLKRERDMFAKHYRTANTRIIQFQDSINKHCLCK